MKAEYFLEPQVLHYKINGIQESSNRSKDYANKEIYQDAIWAYKMVTIF